MVPERQFGPYRLIRQIAVGGMAEIHLAKTAGIAGFEKHVALKMIHPNFAENDQFIQMLVDEAKIAVQLTHGNIAQTFDLGRVGDTYYITMEYVDGADLYKILQRASEQNLEMPLDVCAFVGKEISSALDHAHRKRDHVGKPLGIVHRDVSPQNVLVSYSGEVKLVDFGIAKATMKVRQTAAGVIKGKYYYMSPEQAWGNPIDHRSDIFSAGIVLYELITGQMLYLEEDMHKLLEMARNADIAPPSKLRRGVPPQLERIIMRALAKVPGERYQSAGDLAADLERFLHAYAPVFTASKLSSLLRQVVGDPRPAPDDGSFNRIEFRDGVMSTHPIHEAEIAHATDRDDLRDENSVIFQVSDLAQAKQVMPASRARTPSPAPPGATRQIDEETRRLESPAPESPIHDESSDRFTLDGDTLSMKSGARGDMTEEDLENIGEHTLVTAAPGMAGIPGFMMDVAGDDGGGPVEATLVTTIPTPGPGSRSENHSNAERPDGDGAKVARDFAFDQLTKPARPKTKAPPPAALAAKIQAPAVSELRKPRPSRRTPPGGTPIQPSEPMPAPRPAPALAPPPAPPGPAPAPPPAMAPHSPHMVTDPFASQFPAGTPGPQASYSHDASGLPLGLPTPPGVSLQQAPEMAAHLQPYLHTQGLPAGYGAQPMAMHAPPHRYPQLAPGAVYPFQPSPVPQAMSITDQMRLFEANELPSQYKRNAARRQWFTYIISGILAVSVAAGVAFVIVRSTLKSTPVLGSVGGEVLVTTSLQSILGKIIIDSVPPNAEIRINGQLRGRTPTTINDVDMDNTRRLELRLKDYQPLVQDLAWPNDRTIRINAKLVR
jgi:serine/threonine protein kinase